MKAQKKKKELLSEKVQVRLKPSEKQLIAELAAKDEVSESHILRLAFKKTHEEQK